MNVFDVINPSYFSLTCQSNPEGENQVQSYILSHRKSSFTWKHDYESNIKNKETQERRRGSDKDIIFCLLVAIDNAIGP